MAGQRQERARSAWRQLRDGVRPRIIATAFTVERGGTAALSRLARRRGWTPAVIPYVGYAGPESARVLARVVLSPSSVEPSVARGVSGLRRLLTLEQPGVDVVIELAGHRRTVISDVAGLVDVTFDVSLPPGRATALLRTGERAAQEASVLVAAASAEVGVVCDIDDTAWITGLRHPLRAAWRMLSGSSADRHAVPGMAALLTSIVADQQHPAVVYLSNGPWNLAGPVARFLDREGFPAGALLMTDWGLRRDRWFRDGQAHKKGSLERLTGDFPWVRWVLVGDDGEHDPDIYTDFAHRYPDATSAIALRQVGAQRDDADPSPERIGEVPVFRAPDGTQLLALLRAARSI